MRKSGKIFGILLAVIFVVTSSASAVFADADPTITNYGETDYYNWYYYSDKFLDIGLKEGQIYVPLEELPAYILDEAESVMVFVNEQRIESLSIDGAGCNASSLLIRGDGKVNYNILVVSGFPNVVDGSEFVIPEGDMVYSLMLSGFNFTSLEFMNKLNVYSVTFSCCNKLTDVVMPPFRGVSFANCDNLKKAEVSSTTTIFHFHDCSSLIEVHLPKGLQQICTDSFDNCVLLSDIYFDGTIDEWDKIQVLDHYDPTDLKADSVIGGARKHFIVLTGWVQVEGCWFYYDEDGIMLQNKWLNESGNWYYLDGSGYMATGWKQISGKWYYFEGSGAMVSGWKSIGGTWYYFNAGGDMVTGWKQISGKWYYFEGSGAMVSGWKSVGGTWYYFNAGGDMVTGWKQISGKWYYFEGSGAMAKGWKSIGGSWYYLNDGGEMATGWKQISGKWYYFYDSGAMAYGTTIDGWTLDSSGAWIEK